MIVPPLNPVAAALAGAAQVKPQNPTPTAAQTMIRRAAKPVDARDKLQARTRRNRDTEKEEELLRGQKYDLSV